MTENFTHLSKKQQNTLSHILDIAETVISDNGLGELNLNLICKQPNINKATFARHIPNKETLIAYLAINSLDKMLNFAERAKNIDGQARIKFVGVYTGYIIFLKSNPLVFEFIIQTYANKPFISARISALFDEKIALIIGQIQWCIDLAWFNEEITLPGRLTMFDLAFYIWSSYIGIVSATGSKENMRAAADKYKHFERITLDSWPWHPLSTEIDYDNIEANIESLLKSKN